MLEVFEFLLKVALDIVAGCIFPSEEGVDLPVQTRVVSGVHHKQRFESFRDTRIVDSSNLEAYTRILGDVVEPVDSGREQMRLLSYDTGGSRRHELVLEF